MKIQNGFLLMIAFFALSIPIHGQPITLNASGGLQVSSVTNPGRDYQIICGGRQDIYASNDLVTHSQGHSLFSVGESGATNRGFLISDGVSGTQFFYGHADSQRIGIGVSGNKPKSKLHLKGGDMYIEDIGDGIIMTSPNGTCWKMTINDSGAAVITVVTPCPI